MFGHTVFEILIHLVRHRARTLLTISGLAVGIFALTLIGSLAETFGLAFSSQEEAALGVMDVRAVRWERRLTPATRRAISRVPGVAGTTTRLWASLADPEERDNEGESFELVSESVLAMDSDLPGMAYGPPLFDEKLLEGHLPGPNVTSEAVLDFDLARAHGWEVGDTIPIRGRPFVVASILERPPLGDTRNAYVDYDALRALLNYPPGELWTLAVVPEPGQDPTALAARIVEQVPDVRVQTPEQRQEEMRRSFGMFGAIAGVSAGLALLAGSLLIVNTMLMSVRERRCEIGLKKALGAGDGDIVLEFLLEAGTLGALGGGLGVLLAWFLVLGVNQFTRARWGLALLNPTPRLVLAGMAFSSLLGALAGAYPAWRAARQEPVQALYDLSAVDYAERGWRRLLYLAGRRARWLLTVAGISVGILILTVALSLTEYLNDFTRSAVNATQDRVGLYARRRPNMAYSTTVRELERLEGVRGVVVMAHGDRLLGDDAELPLSFTRTPMFAGIDSPTGEFGFNLPYRAEIARGRYLAPGSLDEIVLGPRLADALGLDVGDLLTIRDRQFTVVGIWQAPATTFPDDYSFDAYVTMAGLRRALPGPPAFPQITALVAPDTNAVAQAQAQLDKATVALQQAQAAYDRIKDRPEAAMTSQALALQQATIDYQVARTAFEVAGRKATPAEVAAAQARLAAARAALSRAQEGPSQADLAAARSRIRGAEATLAQAKEGPSQADIAAAEAALAQARTQVAQAEADLEAATLRAPFDGTLVAVDADPGEVVSSAPFIVLADLTAWRVETVDVDEWLVARLAVGQAVSLSFPAFDDKALEGTILSIAPRAEQQEGGDPYYTVVVALEGADPALKWGMTTRLDFGQEEP